MNPAKNRDRKCSTCRHYQPSPLWRKGWCRNPLLYDRNTNHLVEADSLACNRTFIDYWEPIQGPAPTVGPPARAGSRPRIAPSIPIDTTDSKGRRGVVTGNTPAGGVAAVASQPMQEPDDASMRQGGREVPKLSLVTPDYEPNGPNWPEPASKVTREIPQVGGPGSDDGTPKTAAQRISAARAARRSYMATTTGRLTIALVVLLLLVAAGGGYMMLKNKNGALALASATATVAPTKPVPTPTGLGDATNTPVPTNTPKPPPANVLAVGGWAQVQGGSGLVLRDAPARSGKRLGVLTPGTKAHIVDGPKSADGYTWWKVDKFDGKNPTSSGWVAGQFLNPSTAP
jgi:Bacterial SH3 domain